MLCRAASTVAVERGEAAIADAMAAVQGACRDAGRESACTVMREAFQAMRARLQTAEDTLGALHQAKRDVLVAQDELITAQQDLAAAKQVGCARARVCV